MDKKLMEITCDPQCGFMMRTHNKDELITDVKAHTEKIHDMKSSDQDIMAQIKYV